MDVGADPFDRLAYALANAAFDFDAVEHDRYRAAWSEDGTSVTVEHLDSGEVVGYTADDLVVATSDPELQDARWPESEQP